jgi:di/tripeptidase
MSFLNKVTVGPLLAFSVAMSAQLATAGEQNTRLPQVSPTVLCELYDGFGHGSSKTAAVEAINEIVYRMALQHASLREKAAATEKSDRYYGAG